MPPVVSCCAMKIIEKLRDFPAVAPKLRGLQAEAYELLKTVTKDRPVLKIDLGGQSVAVGKRAFTAAAKALKGGVESRLSEDNTLLVKWLNAPRARAGAHRVAASLVHAAEAVEAEAKRLWTLKGEGGTYEKLSDAVKRALRISAKRNLSRRAR